MKKWNTLYISTLAMVSFTGYSQQMVSEQQPPVDCIAWENYGSLKFNMTAQGQYTNKFELYKNNDRSILSVTTPEEELIMIQTQHSALFKNVGESGYYTEEQCYERIGALHTDLLSYPSNVLFFLNKSAPYGVQSFGSQVMNFQEKKIEGKVWIGEVGLIDGEKVIGDYISLEAPWGANGNIQYKPSTTFNFSYYSSSNGNKDIVDVIGEWNRTEPMPAFDKEPSINWLACVREDVKNELVKESPKTVAEILHIIEASQ